LESRFFLFLGLAANISRAKWVHKGLEGLKKEWSLGARGLALKKAEACFAYQKKTVRGLGSAPALKATPLGWYYPSWELKGVRELRRARDPA
jgi:hypothetical protein